MMGTEDYLLERIIHDVRIEFARATAEHGEFASPHEGYGVIREELEKELFLELICTDKGYTQEARHEAIQVAAMAIRYIYDLIPDG